MKRLADRTKKTTAKKLTAKKKVATKKTTAKKKVATKKLTAKKRPKKASRRRAMRPSPEGPTLDRLPALWWVETGAQTVGLWVDDFVWTGNQRGEVLCLDRDTGTLVRDAHLPGECVAVLSDELWKYAGCADGNVYDLTGDVPRAVYELGGARVDWLEVYRGALCVSDHAGTVTVIDVDGSVRWRKADPAATEAWVLRTADDGLYHGSMVGLRKYDWSGALVWEQRVGDVRYGVISDDDMAVTAGFNTRGKRVDLVVLDRATGATRWSKRAFTAMGNFVSDGGEACGVGRTASGALRYYASVGRWVFCYDASGALVWQSPTRCTSLCNLQIVGERMYFVSNNGAIGCADVSEAAIAAAISGAHAAPSTRAQGRVTRRSHALETTSDASTGVIVECVKDGSRLRVRVVSPGYHADWFCQFPHDIREEGARYVVDEVREASQGGFYRARGNIRRLV